MLTVRVSISPSMDTRSRSVACSSAGQGFGFVGGHRRHRDDDELVAAEAGDQVGAFGAFAESFREDPDEPVACRMTQVVVDRLEPVQVEEQRRDGAGLSGRQSPVEVGQQGTTVVEPRQVVVLGEKAQLVLGDDAGLQLREQRCDRLECVELLGRPFAVAELDEPQDAGRDVPRQHGHARHRRRGDVAAFLDGALVVVGRGFRAKDDGSPSGARRAAKTGSASAKYTTPSGSGSGMSGRTGHSAISFVARMLVIVVPQEADIDPEVADEVGQHALTHRGEVAASTAISSVATAVTTSSRVRATFAPGSAVMREAYWQQRPGGDSVPTWRANRRISVPAPLTRRAR